MPDGDGLWLLSQLGQFNARARSGRIPVIVLTAHADTTERAAEARARADDYLSKPFEPDHLIATVRRWLAAGRTGAPACP
jgi:CheY-like chemotaxis protein